MSDENTLRDDFAKEVMGRIIGNIRTEDDYRRLKNHAEQKELTVSLWIAVDAYKQADAMLKVRKLGLNAFGRIPSNGYPT